MEVFFTKEWIMNSGGIEILGFCRPGLDKATSWKTRSNLLQTSMKSRLECMGVLLFVHLDDFLFVWY